MTDIATMSPAEIEAEYETMKRTRIADGLVAARVQLAAALGADSAKAVEQLIDAKIEIVAAPRRLIRTGDTVLHLASGERWSVAYVVDDRLAWSGWPDGEAPVGEFFLVRSCTDAEHVAALQRIARTDGRRGAFARQQLDNLGLAFAPEPAPAEHQAEAAAPARKGGKA